MAQPSAEPSGAPPVIDTRGEENFTPTYVAVVLIEIVVLTALWLFSRHFSA